MENQFAQLAHDILALPSNPHVYGPLTEGAWINVGFGMGFYVPQPAFDECKRIARETRIIQFLTVTRDGTPFHGTRDECLDKGFGCVAWITPE
jgi:hypothetical protein